MKPRIEKTLLALGLASVPATTDEPLADSGFDSLLMALSISALEREFAVKIPASRVDETTFRSIDSIAELLASLGAK